MLPGVCGFTPPIRPAFFFSPCSCGPHPRAIDVTELFNPTCLVRARFDSPLSFRYFTLSCCCCLCATPSIRIPPSTTCTSIHHTLHHHHPHHPHHPHHRLVASSGTLLRILQTSLPTPLHHAASVLAARCGLVPSHRPWLRLRLRYDYGCSLCHGFCICSRRIKKIPVWAARSRFPVPIADPELGESQQTDRTSRLLPRIAASSSFLLPKTTAH